MSSEAEFVHRVNRARNLLGIGKLDDQTAIKTMVESGETKEDAFHAVKAAKVLLRPDIALDETLDE